MDVNKAEAAQPLTDHGGRRQQSRHGEPDGETASKSEGERAETPAVELDGLAGEMSPEALAAFERLAGKLEPLRRRAAAAEARIEELREVAGRHAFLDLPNRREFLRELDFVIGHAGDMNPPPALALIHLDGAEAYRLCYGRAALDELLIHLRHTMVRALGPSDALGSLGGVDFAAILLLNAGEETMARCETVRTALAAALPEGLVPRVAGRTLAARDSAETALKAVDSALRVDNGG